MAILKRLRGILGTAFTWAAGWGFAGTVLHGVFRLVGWSGFLVPDLGVEIIVHAMMGFLGGAAFSAGLLATERNRVLSGIRTWRFSVWGGVAGLAGPILGFFLGGDLTLNVLSTTWPLFLGTTVFGAASGGGMAILAKQQDQDEIEPGDPPALLEPEASGTL